MEVKLEDVARRAGFSKATVSLALNGSEKINRLTREHIIAIAREMGYTPNPYARKLATRRSNLIGLIVPDIENSYYASLVHHISRSLLTSDYGLFISISENSSAREKKIVEEMIENRMDGILLVPVNQPNTDTDYFKHLETIGTPLVFVTSIYPEVNQPSVMCDLYGGMRAMIRHLCAQGRREIILIDGPVGVYCMDLRAQAYLDEIAAQGLSYTKILQVEDVTYAGALELIRAHKAQHADAIVCVNDMMALGVINGLSELGVRVPEDIAVAGYDDVIFSRVSPVSITTVQQDLACVASDATSLILQMIAGKQKAKRNLMIECPVVVRASTTQSKNN